MFFTFATFAGLACISPVAYLFVGDKSTHSVKKKLTPLWPYIGALFMQAVTWVFAIQGGRYVTNFQSADPNSQCPTSNNWAVLVAITGGLSILLTVTALIFAIKAKRTKHIITSVWLILALGFLSFLALFAGSFCLTF